MISNGPCRQVAEQDSLACLPLIGSNYIGLPPSSGGRAGQPHVPASDHGAGGAAVHVTGGRARLSVSLPVGNEL